MTSECPNSNWYAGREGKQKDGYVLKDRRTGAVAAGRRPVQQWSRVEVTFGAHVFGRRMDRVVLLVGLFQIKII